MATKVPPVPTQGAMTDDDGKATPVWTDFFTQMRARVGGSLGTDGDWAVSKASSGYQKFPSGICIQWGVTASVASGDTLAVSFPVAFDNACFQVTPSLYSIASDDTASTGHYGSGTYTKTGFNLYNRTDSDHVFNWMAIGY